MANVFSSLALLVSLGSWWVAWKAYRLQRRTTNMELARSLHADLTSGEVAKARDTLGTIVYDRGAMASGDKDSRIARYTQARQDCFTLLWCFERIWAGREKIIADDRAGARGVACLYLDEIIGWHVFEWAKGFPTVKSVIERELGVEISDRGDKEAKGEDSWIAFEKLCDALLTLEQKSVIEHLKSPG